MPDLLKDLNQQQKEAVTAGLGPVLVLAGAGSGKTRVLTYRIAYLLQEKLFAPEDLLALTFTNKASTEMKERVYTLLGKKKAQPSLTMGTFHSVCNRILRQEIVNLNQGYKQNFAIFDSDDSRRLIKQIVIELGLQDNFRPQVFSYYISAAKNRLTSPLELALDNPFLQESLQEVFERYQDQLRLQNALDFDDLLGKTCELLRIKDIRKKYQKRFKYILVDEYQDTNHAQYFMLQQLTGKNQNIFVVGDDAQSIYGFRGANMQNILNFKQDHPKAKVIALEQNYRSTQAILDVADKVIGLNKFQYEKKLWTDNKKGVKVQIYAAKDDFSEGEFVVRELLRDQAVAELDPDFAQHETEEGSRPTSILDQYMARKKNFQFTQAPRLVARELPNDLQETVILYRTHAQSRIFEEVLLSAGIPYQIIGGIKFYERKEIKDVLAYLRLLHNPRDLVSLSRVINVPTRGIGPANFKRLVEALPKYKYNYGRLQNNLEGLELSSRAVSGAREFFGLLQEALKFPKDKGLLELMEFVVVKSGYKAHLQDGSAEGLSRLENVEQLFNVSTHFKEVAWKRGLSEFLTEVALISDLDQASDETDRLTLMTLHSAKGLEFNRVFFVGLEEGLLPHSRSLNSPEELSEEIRLAYVGITRAKKELYLSFARERQSYGGRFVRWVWLSGTGQSW